MFPTLLYMRVYLLKIFCFYKKYLISLFYKPSENKQKRLPGGDFQEKTFLKKLY